MTSVPMTGAPTFAVVPGAQVHEALHGHEQDVIATVEAARLADARGERPRRVGFFGVGLIARYLHTYLAANGFDFTEAGVHDLSADHAHGFADYLRRAEGEDLAVTVHEKPEDLVRSADLVVFATVAGEPHVTDPAWFAHHPLVLHISLRDLSPEIVLDSWNVVDDIDHCLKAGTSPHLAEQRVGHRAFVAGTLYDVLTGTITPPADRTVVFSPFGLGVLDLAVAKHVHDQVLAAGRLHTVPDFFHELKRYG